MPLQIPTFLKVGERLRLVKRSGINDIFDLLRRAGVTRFKFAVPIVAYMCNKRYRRRQFDNADSEFGNLEKPDIKEIHCFRAVDFCGCEPLQIPTFLKVGKRLRLVKRSALYNIEESRFDFSKRLSKQVGYLAGVPFSCISRDYSLSNHRRVDGDEIFHLK